MKKLLATTAFLAISATVWYMNPGPGAQGAVSLSTKMEVAAMNYHGIGFCTHDPASGSFFMREGKRCTLFTQAFKTRYARRN